MAKRYSLGLRNALANQIETYIGTGPVLKIRSGARPTNFTDAEQGTVLATIQLPADWFTDAVAGVKSLLGTWQDLLADATGVAGHFRLYRADGVTVEQDGTITATGGGGDMTMDNTSLVAGQAVNITGYTDTIGGA